MIVDQIEISGQLYTKVELLGPFFVALPHTTLPVSAYVHTLFLFLVLDVLCFYS